MINLLETTFIIPVGIESSDREDNVNITLSYLDKHLNTNIIILEYDTFPKIGKILEKLKLRNNVNYIFSKNSTGNPIFHRTKFLNEMLMKVKTNVVVNYDVDILLEPWTYKECSSLIENGQDLVYPYFWGDSQYQVLKSGKDKIKKSLDLNSLAASDKNLTRSEYGHCQFFNTAKYIEGGMENEGFISYAPEDQERGYRFKKLDYNVTWANNYVYHIEHSRGINSSGSNPMMQHNNDLFNHIKSLSKEDLIKYYNEISYKAKYKK